MSDCRRTLNAERLLAARFGASLFVNAYTEEHPGGDVRDRDRGSLARSASFLLPSHDPLQSD